jgi:hypothetical protein
VLKVLTFKNGCSSSVLSSFMVWSARFAIPLHAACCTNLLLSRTHCSSPPTTLGNTVAGKGEAEADEVEVEGGAAPERVLKNWMIGADLLLTSNGMYKM